MLLIIMTVQVAPDRTEAPTSSHEVVNRLNYGVMLKEESKLFLTSEYWLHTYELQLPIARSIKFNDITCPLNNASCFVLDNMLDHIKNLKTDVETNVKDTIATIYDIIPHTSHSAFRMGRTKRAFLSFIGDLSKTLFGTATVKDLQILAKHVQSITSKNQRITDLLSQHETDLSSFISQADHRFHDLVEKLTFNQHEITNLAKQFGDYAADSEVIFSTTINYLTKVLRSVLTIDAKLDKLCNAIVQIAQGKLNPTLITPGMIQNSLHHIQNILLKKYPGFYLTKTVPADYFTQADFIVARRHHMLYISIKFPLSAEHPLRLFRIYVFPLPINHTSTHATQLMDLPEFVAVSKNNKHYVSLNQVDFSTCTKNRHIYCNQNLAVRLTTYQSCILAIFQNDREAVDSLCDFRFRSNTLHPEIIEMTPGTVLVYNTPSLQLTCTNSTQITTGCNLCLMNISCQCAVVSKTHYLPPRILDCARNQEPVTVMYPINLALLRNFFDDSKTSDIFANTTFSSPIQIKLPLFKMYQSNFSDLIAQDKQDHLSLKKMVKRAKSRAVIYKNLAEPLLDGETALPDGWGDTKSLMLLTSLALATLSALFLVVTYFKLKKLMAMITVLSQMKSINATPILPTFNYFNIPSPTNQDLANSLSNEQLISVITLICQCLTLAISVIIIVTLIIWLSRRRQHSTYLIMELSSGYHTIMITLLKLPVCPNSMKIIKPTEITDIGVQGCIFPKLHYQLMDIKIVNTLNDGMIIVPASISIWPHQAKQINQISSKPFNAYLLIQHCGMYRYLNPSEAISDPDMCVSKLYPSLQDK
jgi:hypothetical protein